MISILILLFLVPAVWACDAIDTVYVNEPILIKGGEIFSNKYFICTTDTIIDSAACDNPFIFPDPEFMALDSVIIKYAPEVPEPERD